MTTEHERKIIRREPQKGALSRIKRSISEKIPGTSAFMEKVDNQIRMERERCIQEEVLLDLERKGLLGVHQLEALPKAHRGVYGDMKGAMRGGFFLLFGAITGEVEGEVKTSSSIQFAWKTNNEAEELVISEIPVDEFVFEVGDELERPTVEFHFNPYLLIRHIQIMPTKYTARVFPHPNDYLKPKLLDRVVLTLDSETYKSLPLPTTSPRE